jgi:hypothetical protein
LPLSYLAHHSSWVLHEFAAWKVDSIQYTCVMVDRTPCELSRNVMGPHFKQGPL